MNNCSLCPRNCLVNRYKGDVGYCGCGSDMVIARYSLHLWEEPCISGDKGSGTIFFSGCNLGCIYCQNYNISEKIVGRVVDVDKFSDICIELQDKGANNINLVTGTMYVPLIVEGLKIARDKGLVIPVIYNTSSYENIDTIRMLDGLVDVYLPDLKYYDKEVGIKYSNCSDYFDYACRAIEEMYRQVGNFVFDDDGMIKKGVIVRHLMLPGNESDSKMIIKYLYSKYKDNIFISIMNQYTPLKILEYEELNSIVCDSDYDSVIDYAYNLGVRNAFVQDGSTQSGGFIPDFYEFKGI